MLVVWQGGERAISGAMTVGAFVAYLELYLRFVNRGYRVPQMINSVQGGAAAYARIRPLLTSPPPLSGEPTRASFRAGHIAGINDLVPEPPTVPAGPVAVSLSGTSPFVTRLPLRLFRIQGLPTAAALSGPHRPLDSRQQ